MNFKENNKSEIMALASDSLFDKSGLFVEQSCNHCGAHHSGAVSASVGPGLTDFENLDFDDLHI